MISENVLENIEAELSEMDGSTSSRGGSGEAEKEIPGFNLQEIILQIESIGNNYLKNMNDKLAIPDEQLQVHSELLSIVIEKNFSVEAVKNSPEFLLLGHTAIIGIGIYKKYEYLKTKGEL